MKQFNFSFTKLDTYAGMNNRPDFNNLIKIMKHQKPLRPTIFEYFLNDNIYNYMSQFKEYDSADPLLLCKKQIDTFHMLGYDYTTITGADFFFKINRHTKADAKSISMNEGGVISDWESFEKYEWPNPENYDFSRLEKLKDYLPEGMKILLSDFNGILEQTIELVGYDNLCFMTIDEPELAKAIFDKVGEIHLKYHKICAAYDSVGAHIFGDDWGFNSQTMLSPEDLRKYIIPWHKKDVEAVHKEGKYAILHSCGKLDSVMDDIIDDIGYDAKHSYEDKIHPVEEMYEKYNDRIAVLGGIDVDFLCRSTPKEIYDRACRMLERSDQRGAYALGSGNSIPTYVPTENFLAMISAAIMNR